MLAYGLLVIGFLALPTFSFHALPPTHAQRDTISSCAKWVVALPSETCEMLAKKSSVPLGDFLHFNPSLVKNCSATTGVSYCTKASYELDENRKESKELDLRDGGSSTSKMAQLIGWLFLFKTITQTDIENLWDSRITPIFNSLSYADFSDYLQRSPDAQLYIQEMSRDVFQDYIACNMQLFNDKVGKFKGKGNKPFICICFTNNCCEADESCPAFSPNSRRDLARGPGLLRSTENGISMRHDRPASQEKRASNDYDWSASRNGQTYSGRYTAIAWPGPSDFPASDWIWQHVYSMALEDDCTITYIKQYTRTQIANYLRPLNEGIDEIDYAQVEHWVEKNVLARFTADVVSQTLPSGRPFQHAAAISPTFFTQFMTTTQLNLQGVATVPGASSELTPVRRIMHALGSRTYTSNFVLLQAQLNNMKEGILKGDKPIADDAFRQLMVSSPRAFATNLRRVFSTISYINEDTALGKGENLLKGIRWEWYNYQNLYAPYVGGTAPDVVAAWDEWFKDYMNKRLLDARDWLIKWATEGQTHYSNSQDPVYQTAELLMDKYIDWADGLGGFNDITYPSGTPTAPQ